MYDARSSSVDNANLIFGIVTVVVVGIAFAVAWFGTGWLSSDSSAGSSLPVQVNVSGESPLAQAFPSRDEQRLLGALAQLDAEEYSVLEMGIVKARNREAEIEVLSESIGRAMIENVEHLARISSTDINRMLESASRALNAAHRSGNALCMGSTYADFEHLGPRQAEREAKRLIEKAGLTMETAHAIAVSFQADLLEMTVRARSNPQRHGKLTPQDEAAFQTLMISFMSDPAFVDLAMAGSQENALASMNFCEMGAKVLREVRALPDGTKARAWASIFDLPEVREGLREAKNYAF
ncbi:MAG: hypothetical protein AAF829_03610 [Pseudomonadota bacterium]